MPYKSWDAVNPAIKGIKPKVSLSQANTIASWADKIKGVESPWAVAISQFKKTYTVRNGKWVKKKAAAKESEEIEMTQVQQVEEAKTKKMGNRTHVSGDFLVVEDPDSPSTWHLPVKIKGKPNRGLAGAAWAALFSKEGFRGKPYAGPNKAGAKSKLRALYKAQKWEEPTSEVEAEEAYAEEYGEEGYDIPHRNFAYYGALSFSDILAAEEADQIAELLELRVSQFGTMTRNIMFHFDIPDKIGALRALFDEFIELIEDAISDAEDAIEVDPDTELDLSESFTGDTWTILDMDLVEGEAEGDPMRAPLDVEFVLIKPGWGNSRDNHYYPREVLERDAEVFEGIKMYTSDHRPEEKSVRTEVAVINAVDGFTEEGAPIGHVTIFDPSFAEATRNRHKAGLLNTLECSILAKGRVRKGEVDGQKANIVEAITSAASVDLVTRAGAGGHALALAESEPSTDKSGGVDSVNEENKITQEQPQEEPTGEVQETTLIEGEPITPEQESEGVPEVGVTVLSSERVQEILAETSLPKDARFLIADRPFTDEQELGEAVEKMIKVLKAASHSGEPFGQGETRPPEPDSLTLEERENQKKARFNAIMREIGATEV